MSFVHLFLHLLPCSYLCSWICSVLQSFKYSVIHSPWYNCNGWLGVKHQVTYSAIHPYNYANFFMHALIHYFIRLFLFSFISLFTSSVVDSYVHSIVYLFVHSVVHSSIMRSFLHTFVRSFVCSFSDLTVHIHNSFIYSLVQYPFIYYLFTSLFFFLFFSPFVYSPAQSVCILFPTGIPIYTKASPTILKTCGTSKSFCRNCASTAWWVSILYRP